MAGLLRDELLRKAKLCAENAVQQLDATCPEYSEAVPDEDARGRAMLATAWSSLGSLYVDLADREDG